MSAIPGFILGILLMLRTIDFMSAGVFHFTRSWNANYSLSRHEDSFLYLSVIFNLRIASLSFEGYRVDVNVYNIVT